MALTPLDIQNKNFSTKMRGYNQDDVDDFLDQVTKDYEDSLQKNRELEKSLKHAEEKLQYFNELKDALNQSIIVAQDTADKVKTSANRESEVIVTSAENTANDLLSSAEKKANLLLNSAQEKATEILTEASGRARQLAVETDDLKKKTRVFHQRLSLMLEAQLEQVKSEEWDDLLKPFSTYVNDSHAIIREVLDKEYTDEVVDAEISTDETVIETPVATEKPIPEQVMNADGVIDPKAMLDLLNKETLSDDK